MLKGWSYVAAGTLTGDTLARGRLWIRSRTDAPGPGTKRVLQPRLPSYRMRKPKSVCGHNFVRPMRESGEVGQCDLRPMLGQGGASWVGACDVMTGINAHCAPV